MRQVHYRIVASCATAIILMVGCLTCADHVRATEWYGVSYPSSNNSTMYWNMPQYGIYNYGTTNCYAAQIRDDGNVLHVYEASPTEVIVKTNDFTNPLYYYDPENEWVSGTPAPNNGTATITAVALYAIFSLHAPAAKLAFSIDDQATWNESVLLQYPGTATTNYYFRVWNVTEEIEWTAEILNSNQLWVRIDMRPSSAVHYYLDYVGLAYTYTVPWGGGYPGPPNPTNPGDRAWSYTIWNGTGIIGVMGIVGAIGLIAVPAFAIATWRNSDETRIAVFVKTLVAFMFCLTMFMVSITS